MYKEIRRFYNVIFLILTGGLFLFHCFWREKRRGRKEEKEILIGCLSYEPRPGIRSTWTGDRTLNISMCPDLRIKPQPFGYRRILQLPEPQQLEGSTIYKWLECLVFVCLFFNVVKKSRPNMFLKSFCTILKMSNLKYSDFHPSFNLKYCKKPLHTMNILELFLQRILFAT